MQKFADLREQANGTFGLIVTAKCANAEAKSPGGLPGLFLSMRQASQAQALLKSVPSVWLANAVLDRKAPRTRAAAVITAVTAAVVNRLKAQKHRHRAEPWVVVRGTAEVTIGDQMRSVHENESVYIPIGSVHGWRLLFQSTPDRNNNPVLRRHIQIGVHRQADNLAGQSIADSNTALADRIMLIGLPAVLWIRCAMRSEQAAKQTSRGRARLENMSEFGFVLPKS